MQPAGRLADPGRLLSRRETRAISTHASNFQLATRGQFRTVLDLGPAYARAMPASPKATRPTQVDDSRETKSNRTRKRLLDSTAFVLSRKGFAETRVSDIAKRAGVQASAIYYYFVSREELIAEVIWVGMNEVRVEARAVVAALPADASPLDKIDAAVQTHFKWVIQASDYTMASVRNAGQMPSTITRRYHTEAQLYGRFWADLIDEAGEAGLLRDGLEPRAARMLIIGALNWAPEWVDTKRGSYEAVLTTARTLVRSGLSEG